MPSLSQKLRTSNRSGGSSVVGGFLSSPIRVFYSILFICALEVGGDSTRDDAMPRCFRPFRREINLIDGSHDATGFGGVEGDVLTVNARELL